MPRYSYTAKSKSGEKVSGTIDAGDRRGAMLQIEKRGLFPIAVNDAGANAPAVAEAPSSAKDAGKKKAQGPAKASDAAAKTPLKFALLKKRAPRLKLREVLFFTRELTDLITSGMTLGNALNTLSRRKSGKGTEHIIIQLRDDIIKGDSLSEALAKHPHSFTNLYVNMVRSGEAGGRLAEALERLAMYYERVQDAREKVQFAMYYPLFVLVAGIVTMIFMMTVVIPKFADIFKQLGQALPLPTRILIGTSDFLLHWGWLVAVAVGFLVGAFRRYIRTENGRLRWHGFLLRIPIFRGVIQANAFGQFAHTLGALLNNGVPVVQALMIAENTSSNVVIAREIRDARAKVTDGSTISGPLAAGGVFPALLTDMLSIGEETGDMASALKHISARYDKELDRSVKAFTTMLEPIMIVGIALSVGFIAVSLVMAVLKMTSGLSSH